MVSGMKDPDWRLCGNVRRICARKVNAGVRRGLAWDCIANAVWAPLDFIEFLKIPLRQKIR